MPETIKVSPTPIQRNSHDVAIELLELHIKNVAVDYSVEGLQDLYAKFYSTAKFLESVTVKHLKGYLPEDMKIVITEMYK